MIYRAEIDIMPHAELLDPQGKTVLKNMENVDIQGVQDVRIGKHVTLKVEAGSEEAATTIVQKSCEKLLANMIMEKFSFELFAEEETVTA
ncbi:MAG: phosphoribosylformylglycinamidine synthase subunit PurS [Bacteroidota bacterium]